MGWLSSIATLGVSPVMNLIGAKIASSAAKNAAKTQAAAGQKAILIDKQGQADALGALDRSANQSLGFYAPYQNAGNSALPSLTRLAGSNYPGANQNPYMAPQGAPMMPGGPSMGPPSIATLRSPQPGGEPMVNMMAPNGRDTTQVPQSQVEHFKAKGARVIG